MPKNKRLHRRERKARKFLFDFERHCENHGLTTQLQGKSDVFTVYGFGRVIR